MSDLRDWSTLRTCVPYRDPFKVRSNSIHLPLIDTDTRAIVSKRILSIVQCAKSVSIAVVGNLVVVPGRNPGEVLCQKQQIRIGPVLLTVSAGHGLSILRTAHLSNTRPVIPQAEKHVWWLVSSFTLGGILIYIITQVDLKRL